MTLSTEQRATVSAVIESALNEAEAQWSEHGALLKESVTKALDTALAKADEQVPSKIPGSPLITSTGSKVENFVAFVADMRNSSEHLQSKCSTAKVERLQRVYYETAALLPALEVTIGLEAGSVTEYLGDGVLALFEAKSAEDMAAIHRARRAAENCIGDTRGLVNRELSSRYDLPPLRLGVGLAIGPAIVQLVGLPSRRHAKAIGSCVWRASKLCAGSNSIAVDSSIYLTWPSSKGGPISFTKRDMRGVNGYVMTRKEPVE